MSNDAQFINGLIAKAPHENAPEYVKAKLSIKREELIATLQGMTGDWVNADVKVSSGGRWYVAVDTWKPDSKQTARTPRQESRTPAASDDFADSEIPF